MNINSKTITILCYGDSNTQGTKPDRNGRYTANERWTGLLQNNLGAEYYVIQEGLGDRTTDLDDPNPEKPGRNGLAYFKTYLVNHPSPDVIIIMLGTNDLKTVYNRSPEDVARALKQYPEYVREYYSTKSVKPPRILLVSPIQLDETAPAYHSNKLTNKMYDDISAQKSRQLPESIKVAASEAGCEFFDASTVARAGGDGRHLDAASQQQLANSFTKIIKNIPLLRAS